MRRQLSNVLAVLSLCLAVLLAFGYVGKVGVEVHSNVLGVATPHYRELTFAVEDGRIMYWDETGPVPGTGALAGTRARWVHRFFRAPSLRRSIWEFDAHTLPVGNSRAFILACPIWCALAPLLILPGLRLWRRMRPSEAPQGFEVRSAAAAS